MKMQVTTYHSPNVNKHIYGQYCTFQFEVDSSQLCQQITLISIKLQLAK